MPRVLKRLLLFGGLLLVLIAAATALIGWLALRQFTPEKVVLELESVCNARVQLDGCTLSLFSSPARLELNGLHFHPRDTEADRATPPSTRPPIKITNTYLRMRRGVVEADLAALVLRRELRVKNLLIEVGDVKCDILPSGENSLRDLFRAPSTVAGRPNPALAVLAPVAAAVAVTAVTTQPPPPPDAPETPARADDKSDPAEIDSGPIPVLYARDLRGHVAIDSISFTDSRIRIRNRKTRAVTELNQLHLTVTDLAVDPARLADANRAAIAFRSRVWVDGGKKNPGRLAELDVRVEGAATPFDADTGLLQPDFQFATTIARGATLRSLPALEKIEKNLARARRAGLKFDSFSTPTVLASDTTLNLRLRANRLVLVQPATLDFTDYALTIGAGSAIDVATETHDVTAAWVASQAISDKALGGAQDFLSTLGNDVGKELRALLIDPVVKDGRLHMDFTSQGELVKPDVRIAHPLQDVTDQLKDAGRSLIDRLKDN